MSKGHLEVSLEFKVGKIPFGSARLQDLQQERQFKKNNNFQNLTIFNNYFKEFSQFILKLQKKSINGNVVARDLIPI